MLRKFTIKDVRCFKGEQEIKIRPTTFLIGENSTGKTTVLGCLQALFDAVLYFKGLDFNLLPYNMGAFVDIVRRMEPPKKEFQLGFQYETNEQVILYTFSFQENPNGTEPILKDAALEIKDTLKLTFKSINKENQKVDTPYSNSHSIQNIEEKDEKKFYHIFW